MSKAKLYTNDGTSKSEVDLPDSLFAGAVSPESIYQYVIMYQANQRQGTSKTKSRSEVSGTNQKPWKQKGTGRARSGSNTSPIWVRGGKAHGPIPRKYHSKLNKKQKKLALVSALTTKATDGEIHIFEELTLADHKTKNLTAILANAKINSKGSLILLSEANEKLMLAARNIPALNVSQVRELNAFDVVSNKNVIFTQSALASLTELQEASA